MKYLSKCLPLTAWILMGYVPLASASPQDTCYQQCADQFDMCDLHCDPYGGPSGCQACYDQFYDCQDFCGQCPIVNDRLDPPVPVSYTPLTGSICLTDNVEHPVGAAPSNIFTKYRIRYRQTTTRVTQTCEGPVTYQVIDTQFYNQICWKDTDIMCGIPSGGNASSYCTF